MYFPLHKFDNKKYHSKKSLDWKRNHDEIKRDLKMNELTIQLNDLERENNLERKEFRRNNIKHR